VRGKVEGFELDEKEIPEQIKEAARVRSQAHWLLAYSTLQIPAKRPALILIGGLPGTGKSTLAHSLAEELQCQVIRTDLVRKELAGFQGASIAGTFGQGMYSEEMTDRTYNECLKRTERAFFEGERVIIDANFRKESQRKLFRQAATRWALPSIMLWCQADPGIVRFRLAHRHGDASDADWSIYEKSVSDLEPFGKDDSDWVHDIHTGSSMDQSILAAKTVLKQIDLL
jgi:predicted kinase